MDVIRPCYIPIVMREVIETVSEVQFRSIAVIVAVALLGMLAAWWVLTGSASPSLTTVQTETSSVSLPEPQARIPAPQQNFETAQPEVRIEQGHVGRALPLAGDKSSITSPVVKAASGFTVQIGAFQKIEGAEKRL
ncbi:MAG: hypothetical protein ACWGQW_24045, partial [bacterium]